LVQHFRKVVYVFFVKIRTFYYYFMYQIFLKIYGF
jgi:hypothetical protein